MLVLPGSLNAWSSVHGTHASLVSSGWNVLAGHSKHTVLFGAEIRPAPQDRHALLPRPFAVPAVQYTHEMTELALEYAYAGSHTQSATLELPFAADVEL